MSKRLIYVSFWKEELEALTQFLKEKGYSQDEITHLENILNRKEE